MADQRDLARSTGMLSRAVRYIYNWLAASSAEDPTRQAVTCTCEAPVATKPAEPTDAEFATAIEENNRSRQRMLLGPLLVGASFYVGWALALGGIALFGADPAPERTPWEVISSFGWSLGLSSGEAQQLVIASLALVAALTIALATSQPPPRGASADTIAAWAGSLTTLALTSLLASGLATAVAVSQVIANPGNAGATVVMAVLTSWLWSGIQSQTDERIERGLRASVKRSLTAWRARLQRKIPDVGTAQTKSRDLSRGHGVVLLVTALASLPIFMFGWSALNVGQSLSAVLAQWGSWLFLVLVFTAFQVFAAAEAWRYWARSARWMEWVAWVLIMLLTAFETLILVWTAITTPSPYSVGAWLSLVLWLALLASICFVPRRNPVARKWFAKDWMLATEQLEELANPANERNVHA